MTSRTRTRRLIATAAAGLAVFLTIIVLLGVQMARGHDPALGASVSTKKATVTTAASTTSTDEDTYSVATDESSSVDSGSTAGQSSQSAATTPTPLQTSSS